MVKQDHTALAWPDPGCDSRCLQPLQVAVQDQAGLQNQPAGCDSSAACSSFATVHNRYTLASMGKPRVPASLSRWRSRVRIPLEASRSRFLGRTSRAACLSSRSFRVQLPEEASRSGAVGQLARLITWRPPVRVRSPQSLPSGPAEGRRSLKPKAGVRLPGGQSRAARNDPDP